MSTDGLLVQRACKTSQVLRRASTPKLDIYTYTHIHIYTHVHIDNVIIRHSADKTCLHSVHPNWTLPGGNVFFLILVIRNMRFTGAFEVGMARARWELVCNRPAEVILNLCAPLR